MKHIALALSASAAAMIFSTPALAGDAPAQSADAVQAELEALRTRVQALEALVEQLAGSQAIAANQAAEARATAVTAQAVATQASEAVTAAPTTVMGAAPRVRTESGWSFQPFGRLQYDFAHVDAPGGVMDRGLGFSNELRRGRIGVQGDIPGGFGYKFEVDFADNDIAITDAIITYDVGGGLEFTVGQHNNFQSLEELTSSRFTSFMERAAFTDAFNFERRVGFSAGYVSGDFRINAGIFTDDIDALTADSNNSYSFDTRAVYSPEIGNTQLHLGGSFHWRDLQNAVGARYRQRPGVHSTDTRFISTGTQPVTEETSYGLEAAVVHGPFHAVAEGHWLHAEAYTMDNPTFFGGYVEAGLFLTGGDTRGYSGGKFNRTRPARTVDEGGIGAVQINARYDYLDLSDIPVGGEQNLFGLSVIWTPIDHARLSINYNHIEYDNVDAGLADGLSRNYGVDVIGVRTEIDF